MLEALDAFLFLAPFDEPVPETIGVYLGYVAPELNPKTAMQRCRLQHDKKDSGSKEENVALQSTQAGLRVYGASKN